MTLSERKSILKASITAIATDMCREVDDAANDAALDEIGRRVAAMSVAETAPAGASKED